MEEVRRLGHPGYLIGRAVELFRSGDAMGAIDLLRNAADRTRVLSCASQRSCDQNTREEFLLRIEHIVGDADGTLLREAQKLMEERFPTHH